MDKRVAINWAIHHMVVDYYQQLITAVRRNITVPGIKFDDFLPVARERVEALLPTIHSEELSCLVEAKKILSWKCVEQVEVEIMAKIQAMKVKE